MCSCHHGCSATLRWCLLTSSAFPVGLLGIFHSQNEPFGGNSWRKSKMIFMASTTTATHAAAVAGLCSSSLRGSPITRVQDGFELRYPPTLGWAFANFGWIWHQWRSIFEWFFVYGILSVPEVGEPLTQLSSPIRETPTLRFHQKCTFVHRFQSPY